MTIHSDEIGPDTGSVAQKIREEWLGKILQLVKFLNN